MIEALARWWGVTEDAVRELVADHEDATERHEYDDEDCPVWNDDDD